MGLTWKPPWEPPWNRTWNLTTDGFRREPQQGVNRAAWAFK